MALVRRQNSLRSRPEQGWNLANTGFSDLFGDVEQLLGELATPFHGQSRWLQSYPVDLYETGEQVVLEMAVPGIHASDLDVSVEGRQLTVSGTFPNITDNEERRYWLQTIPRGQFTRTVTLPTSVAVDDIQASVQEGLLTLSMPKVAEAKARKITINNG